MEAAELPANALPPGWSAAGGAGAKDPEAAQRQAQQVRELSEGSVQLSAFSFQLSLFERFEELGRRGPIFVSH